VISRRATRAALLGFAVVVLTLPAPDATADPGPGDPGSGVGGGGRLNPDINLNAGSSLLFMCPGRGSAANILGGGGGYCDWGFSAQGHY
jgi:hypothetical protein